MSRPPSPRLSTGQRVACVVTALIIVASLGGYGWYQGLVGNITTAQVDTDEWDRPTNVEGAMNLLVIGSDVRSGENADYGEAEGERTDTMLIASINVDNGAATLVNLPRDLVVDLPGCEAVEGYRSERFALEVENQAGGAHETDRRGQGLGVLGMRERADVVDARLDVGPTDGGGWRVRWEIPVEREGSR